ncbi:HAD family hydrolase [uncultured Dysosmobacter sp.]|uniref:D-glycero-alpha-D-manno-heptose-1,7-bisphosphate 7-phosphatase n=1 Tax=uncultured Dysosmobacter sp. TaxID=2591384 RepID=UPI002631CDD3|nr:HAD family hydrolase [uncultured Dysosmobacter sp.]
MSEKRKAAFFDRDGTICEDIGYAHDPKDIHFIAGMPEIIREYNKAGYLVIVITNQSGIARGFFTDQQMQLFHEVMNQRLEKEYGAHIDAFYFCPHLPEITGECECRKPKPGMFLKAISEYNIDPKQSVSYGDSDRDEIASRAAGIERFFLV